MDRKKQVVVFTSITAVSIVICVVGGLLLTRLMGDDIFSSSSSDISTSSQTTTTVIDPTWDGKISLLIPTNTVGGAKEVDISDNVPFYKGTFDSSNVIRVREKNNPYLYRISAPSRDGTISLKYKEKLIEDNKFVYSCDDYFFDTIKQTFVFEYNDYRLMLTTFNDNYVDYLYIRYIPSGDNWPSSVLYNSFINEAYTMIPGMNLTETPIVNALVDSSISFQYNADDQELALYKQTLKYFGYMENNGLYTNTLNNEVMIDMSVNNSISITAPTK